jgi:sugar phosphate isomerase/epimerase
MKLSMMTYTMARQGFNVEDFIKTAVDCQLDGIDWVTTHGRDAKELKKMSDDAGLPVVCHTFILSKMPQGVPYLLDEAKKSIEDAVTLGAPVVMIPTMSNENIARNEFRLQWIKALAEVATLTDDAGIVLTVENFPGKHSAFVTAADFFEAKKEIPQLRLTFDDGNAASGEDPVESFRKCREFIVHAHFKDWDIQAGPSEGYRQMLDGSYYRPALIGEGNVKTADCWKAMKESGYNGYINIEYEGDGISADKAIARAAAFLRNI